LPMNSAGEAIVEFVDISKRYDERSTQHPALDDISFSIDRGEIFGVIGESGAGKSTLLQLINGLTLPDSGSVSVEGRAVTGRSRSEMRELRRDVGLVFQSIDLLSSRTVRQNVALPLKIS